MALEIDWKPVETAPEEGPDVLLALAVYGSPHHPEKPNQFLRWEYALGTPQEGGPVVNDDTGWSSTDYTHWTHIPAPTLEAA